MTVDARPVIDNEGSGYNAMTMMIYYRLVGELVRRREQGAPTEVTLHVKWAAHRIKNVRSKHRVNQKKWHHQEHEQKCPAALAPTKYKKNLRSVELRGTNFVDVMQGENKTRSPLHGGNPIGFLTQRGRNTQDKTYNHAHSDTPAYSFAATSILSK